MKIAPVQNQAIPKTMAAPGLLAHVAVMKFDDHLPLYRQSEIWARRKFQDVWNVAKKEGVASKALEVIGKLYDIEAQIKDLTADEKQQIRKAQAKPILTAFHAWLLEIKANVQSKGLLDKAIQYTLNQWDSLIYYVQNGAVSIDNNAAERHIKPFAIGRKNWLFMGSPDGAKAAANLYSLIETAKLNDVNPEGYLKYVLEHSIDAHDPAHMENLMPWNAPIETGYTKPSLKPKDSEKNLDQNLKTQLEAIKIQINTS